jgi:hypothetical protein
MDRKIEHRPFSLRSFLSNWEWDFARMFSNCILLFFIILLIYLTLLYALSLWRMEAQFHPEWHKHQWEIILDHIVPWGTDGL